MEPAPASPPEPQEPQPFRFGAVLLGLFIDIAATSLLSFVIGIVYAGILIGTGALSNDSDAVNFSRRIEESLDLMILLVISGLSMTCLGGFSGAWLAGHSELKHASWVGVLSLAFGLAGAVLFSGMPRQHGWLYASSLALTVPAAALGGYLRLMVKEMTAK